MSLTGSTDELIRAAIMRELTARGPLTTIEILKALGLTRGQGDRVGRLLRSLETQRQVGYSHSTDRWSPVRVSGAAAGEHEGSPVPGGLMKAIEAEAPRAQVQRPARARANPRDDILKQLETGPMTGKQMVQKLTGVQKAQAVRNALSSMTRAGTIEKRGLRNGIYSLPGSSTDAVRTDAEELADTVDKVWNMPPEPKPPGLPTREQISDVLDGKSAVVTIHIHGDLVLDGEALRKLDDRIGEVMHAAVVLMRAQALIAQSGN